MAGVEKKKKSGPPLLSSCFVVYTPIPVENECKSKVLASTVFGSTVHQMYKQ
jgi:hypothetical protein